MNLQRTLTGVLLALAGLVAHMPAAHAQQAPANGPRPNAPEVHALVNARVVVSPDKSIDAATVVIREGLIEAVGSDLEIPADARIWDLSGHTIHAGFIDLSVPVDPPGDEPASTGRHWNSRVRPERSAASFEGLSDLDRASLRKVGFTTALLVPSEGIFRGSAALVDLSDAADRPRTFVKRGPQVVAFETSGFRSQEYPGSLMGSIALIRQTLLDAEWYASCYDMYERDPKGLRALDPADALAALRPVLARENPRQRVLFNTVDELDLLRVARLVEEFGLTAMVRGSGNEFRRLPEVVETGLAIILPIHFPEAPRVESIEDDEAVSLRQLMQWEQAPTNPRRLINAGVQVALTADTLETPSDFLDSLQRALKEGLTEDQALAALTTTPAALMGVSAVMGSVEAGKVANLVVVEGQGDNLFEEDRKVRSIWINGRRYEIEPEPVVDPRGRWAIIVENAEGELGTAGEITITISGEFEDLTITMSVDDEEYGAKAVDLRHARLSLAIPATATGGDGWDRLATIVEPERMVGQWISADGSRRSWIGARIAPPDFEEADDGKDKDTENDTDAGNVEAGNNGDDKDAEADAAPAPERYPVPLGAFGLLDEPDRPSVIFVSDATVWTGTATGTIQQCDILIRDGRIVAVGQGLIAPAGGYTIDGRGKHVTAGLIDCHSHTGISRRSINEGTQAITSEVRIADVVNPDDINWYRQLAGGLTLVNQLHGSANPIGGQNSVVKIRWGEGPDAFAVKGAIPGIKFALGENVKQANWGDDFTTRYPQTRMGVEQIIRSAFAAAEDYRRDHERYKNLPAAQNSTTYPPRRDLELEALVGILQGKRIVHSHSYRQDEILMLMRVAEDYGFVIGTFQHVLEGYKVASEIADHGAGASTFSDWWAYKFEVYDAIPYGGALMHNVGVTVSFNSDSNELARHLNLEAAKAVRYGGVNPGDALNFVILNPARQLRIDSFVGSLEPGKDADFVVWSGDPLSTYTRCEQTWIDGVQRFSLERDAELRDYARVERNRIIQKILAIKLSTSASDDDEDDNNDEHDGLTNQPGETDSAAESRGGPSPYDDMKYQYSSQSTLPGDCGFDRVHKLSGERQ